MSTLRDRIVGEDVPGTPTSASTMKDYGSAKQIPLTRIQVRPNGYAYDEPMVASDGAPISPTGLGQWGQLYAVGRA
jgi:hypothetical protein